MISARTISKTFDFRARENSPEPTELTVVKICFDLLHTNSIEGREAGHTELFCEEPLANFRVFPFEF